MPQSAAAPITAGATAQVKAGDLAIGSNTVRYWLTQSGQSFALKNNAGAIKLIVGQDGNVGIGTTVPGDKLTINAGGLGFTGGVAKITTADSVYFDIQATNAGGALRFATAGPASTNTRLYISPSGNVGIGTANPLITLDVNGYIQVQGSDFKLGTNDGRPIGSKTNQRALVHNLNDTLYINYQGDFEGGTVIDSNTLINGNLNVGGNINATGTINSSAGLCMNGDCKTAWSQVGGGGSGSPLSGYSACKPVCGGNNVACPSGWTRAMLVMNGDGCNGDSGWTALPEEQGTIAGPWTWGVLQSESTQEPFRDVTMWEYLCTPGGKGQRKIISGDKTFDLEGHCVDVECNAYSYALGQPHGNDYRSSSCAICCQ
jgi:hypothetical protein